MATEKDQWEQSYGPLLVVFLTLLSRKPHALPKLVLSHCSFNAMWGFKFSLTSALTQMVSSIKFRWSKGGGDDW